MQSIPPQQGQASPQQQPQNESIREKQQATADKQLDTMLKHIPMLKDVDYEVFSMEINLFVQRFGWSSWIMDPNAAPNQQNSFKEDLDISNAYTIILTKCRGHQVADKLMATPNGDGVEAVRLLDEHFHRRTQAGKQKATADFYNITMATSNTDLLSYIAKVTKLAKILARHGSPVDDSNMVTAILRGLLEEFKPIKIILNQDPTLTLKSVCAKLEDFAFQENLLNLQVGGRDTLARNKTFYVKQDHTNQRAPRQEAKRNQNPNVRGVSYHHNGVKHPWRGEAGDCQRYHHGSCNSGRTCHFNHPTTKPAAEANMAREKTPVSKHTPQCHYCGDDGHYMAKCPLNQNTVTYVDQHQDQEPSHVFALHDKPDETHKRTIGVMAIIGVATVFCKNLTSTFNFLRTQKLTCIMLLLALLTVVVQSTNDEPGSNITRSQLYNIKASTPGSPNNGFEWLADAGTNRFVTNDLADFIPGTKKNHNTNVSVGSGNATSPAYGDVLIESLDHTGITIRCNNVLFLPHCEKKLMPTSPFVSKGCTQIFGDYDQCKLTDAKGKPIFNGKSIGGLYYYRTRTVKHPSVIRRHTDVYFGLSANPKGNVGYEFGNKLLEAHWAYGHLHFNKLRKLLGLRKGNDPDCAACTIALSREQALSQVKHTRATRVNHTKHLDIGYSRDMLYCFQVVVDDYTRESVLQNLENKGEAYQAFEVLQRQHDNEYAPYSLAVLHCDGEFVYDNKTFDRFCETHGVRREYSGRHKHGQHGVAERCMQAIGGPYRCMMIHANCPQSDTPHCFHHANVIRNNSPTKANNGWTPREKGMGRRLPVNKRLLRAPFGCLAFAHVYAQERAKHEPRGIPCVYLGYDDRNNTYKVKEWTTGKIYYTADIDFHPRTFPYRANPQRAHGWLEEYNDIAPLSQALPSSPPVSSSDQPTARRSIRQREYQFSGGIPIAEIPDNYLPAASYASAKNFFIHSFGDDPASWEEAMKSRYAKEWILAMIAEKNSFKHHDVYELVPRMSARGKRIFKAKVVLKMKIKPQTPQHPNGSIEKFKYRLTIAAYTRMMKEGIDYKEKHASTVRWNSIKVMLAIAVHNNLDIYLWDIKTFFLYGELPDSEVVYMEQAPGWEEPGKPTEEWICRLNKSMYGLPQAGHHAQQKLKRTLGEGGFKPTASDDCVYVTQAPELGYGALGSHVDDMVGVCDEKGAERIDATLKKDFEVVKIKNPEIITGVQIERNRPKKWLKLHQNAYIMKLLDKYEMTDCREVDTPMDPGTARALMLLPTAESTPGIRKAYQTLVGELIWLLKTRSIDMHFTISLLSRFLKNATQQHLDLARNRPLRYLKKTSAHGLVFMAGSGEFRPSGASDSDLAGDLMTARSTLGHYINLGGTGAVLTSCGLDRKISTATGQAETYAMQGLIKDVVWLTGFISELGFPVKNPVKLLTDNDGVLKQSTKLINHTTAKHYRIAQAYIREKVSDGLVSVEGVASAKNGSDIFTKALASPLFTFHRDNLSGPQQCPE
jgi:hypothetical protein